MNKIFTSDKAWHFLYCFFIATVGYSLGKLFHVDCGWVLAIFFAVGKEIKDWRDYGKKIGIKGFTKMAGYDLIADMLGILIVYIILV